jgi:hypothetical protein
MGCGPGWEPTNPYPYQTQTHSTPCAVAARAALKMSILFDSSNAAAKLATIPNLATETLEKGFLIMESIVISPQNVNDTTGYGYKTSDIFTGDDTSITINPSYNPNTQAMAGSLHTHPSSGRSAQSPNDIYSLIQSQFENKSRVKGNFVAAANGSIFAVTVTDGNLAATFLNTIGQNLEGRAWKPSSDIGKAFDAAFEHFKTENKTDPNKNNLAYEMAMATVINQFNTGVTLCKRDATSGKFVPLVVRTEIQTSSNGRRAKTVYIRDCN